MVEPFQWPGNWFRLATLAAKERGGKKLSRRRIKTYKRAERTNSSWQGQIYFPGPFPALKTLAGPGGECFARDLLGNSCCNNTKKG